MNSHDPSQVVDLNAAIASIAELLRLVAGDRLTLETNLDPQLSPIPAAPEQIDWLLVNLATNAYHSKPVDSQFIIATSNVELDAAAARQLGVTPGPYAQVDVIVAGTGMDAGERAREIVALAGGRISVHGAGGYRSTITVLLPRLGKAGS